MEKYYTSGGEYLKGAIYKEQATELVKLGIEKMEQFIARSATEKIIREEYCVGGDIFRGYYHPSPVFDIIMGNTKRGRLCKKAVDSPNLIYHYFFNNADRLVRVDSLLQNQIRTKEYLYYEGNIRIGIRVSNLNNKLYSVSKEVFDDNRIASFTRASCDFIDGKVKCFDYEFEEYRYDEQGLVFCHCVSLDPNGGYVFDDLFEFERKDGYLVEYTHTPAPPSKQTPVTYKPGKKRKAIFKTVF